MLQIQLWKRVVIWGLVALGLVFALPNAFYSRVEGHNDAVLDIELKGETPERLAALEAWPSWMPVTLVNLGLDLRGGAHLLAEVRVADVYGERMDGYWPEVRDALRGARGEVGTVRRQASPDDQLWVKISEAGGMEVALGLVRDLATPVVSLSGVGSSDIEVAGDGDVLKIQLSEAERVA
ncbi:MAG: protein translocase subunit SecD, partial [Paracoccaceae bacterium]